MADAQRVIELVFQGVDRTGAATQAALDNLGKFGGNLEAATQPIASFTAGALKIEGALLTAGAAIVAFGVNAAGDFDAAFRQISTIIDASADDLGAFRQAILDYAATSTQPLENITNAIGAAVGSGVDYAKSIDLIAQAERLAVATRSDLDSTTKVLVSTLNSYGMSIEQAGDLSDIFFKIIDMGDISMSDLAASFAKIAPVAAVSGVSLQEIGAAIATLTAAGIAPAESIEYLRGAISNIISPSGQAAALAAELGIEFNAAGLKANGLAGLLQQVADKTGGSADQMKILFGDIGGFTAAATLAGPQAANFAKALGEMGDSAGAVDAAFAKITGSIEVAGAKIANSLKVLLVNIGDPLLDEFGGIADAIAAIFNALGADLKSGGLGGIISVIEGLAQDVQGTLEEVAKNLPRALEQADFSSFEDAIEAVADAVKGLFGGFDLSSTDGLAKAVETVGAAFLGLSKYTAGVIESFQPLFNLLVKVGQGATTLAAGIFQLAGNFGGAITQINLLAGGVNSLLPAFEGLLALLIAKQGIGIVGALQAAVPAAAGLSTALGKAGLVGAAGAAGYAVGTALNEPINDFVSTLAGSEQTLGTWIYELVNGAEEAEKFGAAMTTSAKGADDFSRGVTQIATGLDGVEGAVTKVTNGPFVDYLDAMGNIVLTTTATGESLDAWNAKLLESGGVIDGAAGGAEKLADANKKIVDTTNKVIPIFDAATGKIVGYQQNLAYVDKSAKGLAGSQAEAGNAIKLTAEEANKAADSIQRWNEKVAEMQHAEKLAIIQSQTAITTARIEADAQTMTAAFESVAAAINSTGDTLSSLYGSLENLEGLDRLKVLAEIDKESQRRDEALQKQSELIDAQIRQMEARTEALQRGDAMITIDGAGLAPHLEAFMFEVLRALQVKVNQDGYEMLLGATA